MGRRIAATVSQQRGHRSFVVIALLACLLITGCAQRDRSSDEENRPGGFYGGISAGR
jgi:hypothetical protein